MIRVFRAFEFRGESLIVQPWPKWSQFTQQYVAGVLTSLPAQHDGRGPGWCLPVTIGKGPGLRTVSVPLPPFLSADYYAGSADHPFCLQGVLVEAAKRTAEELAAAEIEGIPDEPEPIASSIRCGKCLTLNAPDSNFCKMCRLELHAARAERARLIQSRDIVVKERDELIKRRAALKERQESLKKQSIEWLWFFRDALYVAERSPHPEELNEVVLRIKAIHFKLDEENRRLLEQVANYEAVESSRSGRTRQAIPDDVKLHVWTRDSGCCVKCQSPKELHFDHIIPLARGGGNQAENIQLLCRTCNLAKSDRLI